MKMRPLIFRVLIALAVGAVAVRAAEPPRADATDAARAETVPPLLQAPATRDADPAPVAGLRVFLDPVTGELVTHPTPAQVRELTRALAEHRFEQEMDPVTSWSPEGLTRFELPVGGTGVNLGGRFLTSTVVHVGPDGELHFECTHDAHDVEAHPETTRKPSPGPALK